MPIAARQGQPLSWLAAHCWTHTLADRRLQFALGSGARLGRLGLPRNPLFGASLLAKALSAPLRRRTFCARARLSPRGTFGDGDDDARLVLNFNDSPDARKDPSGGRRKIKA